MNYVLITGGAGYIGSHICKIFFDAGFVPVTFDNLSKGNKWSVKWGPLELGDLSDEVRLKCLFEKLSSSITIPFSIGDVLILKSSK